MTIFSAREQLATLESTQGYCFPLALDAIMRTAILPAEFYTLFGEGNKEGTNDFNERVTLLINDFFGVQAKPDTESACAAEYNAFGSSEQSYFPDSPYTFNSQADFELKDAGITDKQLRLHTLLTTARERGCNVLFTGPSSKANHVSGLELVDPGGNTSARYIVRDYLKINNNRTYTEDELSGISGALGGYSDNVAPIPEFARLHYPLDQSSWELIVLPPEPL